MHLPNGKNQGSTRKRQLGKKAQSDRENHMDKQERYDVDLCYKFGSYNVGMMNGILALPVYMAPLVASKLSDE